MSGIEVMPCEGEFFEALRGAPPVAPSRTCTPREFRRRFTEQEVGALTLAASRALEAGQPALQMYLDDLSAAQVVDLGDPATVAGVQFLAAAGLIAPGRAAEILGA